MDIPNFSSDKLYKFVLCAAMIMLVCSLENSLFSIDVNSVRTTCILIIFYALIAWVADESYKNSLKEDVYNEQFDKEEFPTKYNNGLKYLNLAVILLSVVTIIFIFS